MPQATVQVQESRGKVNNIESFLQQAWWRVVKGIKFIELFMNNCINIKPISAPWVIKTYRKHATGQV